MPPNTPLDSSIGSKQSTHSTEMKPITVNVPASPDIKKLLKHFKNKIGMPLKSRLSLGEINDNGYHLNQEELLNLFPCGLRLLKTMGYQAGNSNYGEVEFVVAKGNIDIHTDALGYTALMLLKVEALCPSSAVSLERSYYTSDNYLWTERRLTKMNMGTMVVFNSCKPHAWFCSGVATFLSIPVKKTRKQKSNNLIPF